MAGSKYRWPTVVTAAVSLVLSAFCIWFIFSAYHDFRSKDFKLVSEGAITPTTCVEAPTDAQLKAAKYDSVGSCPNVGELANLLAVSVHAMYAANSASAYTGEAKKAFDATVLAVQGVTDAYKITREGAYAALSAIGALAKFDCETIYGETTEGAVPVPVAPPVVCDADVPASNDAPTAAPVANTLYTHCAMQFGYGRAYPTSGTLGIPKFGQEAKPVILPVIATNSTTSWENRARILVGTRFGYSSVFYVVAMLATAFFFMDSTILLLAELTRVDAYFAQNAITQGSGRSMREGMMTMLATFKAKRNLRWAISILLIMLEVLLWVLLVGVPWNFAMGLPRPVCEQGKASHWTTPWFETTDSGWKLDWDAFVLDIMIIVSHVVIAVAVPIAGLAKRGGGSASAGSRDRTGGVQVEGYTGVAVGSLRSSWWFAALSLGGLIFYVGQAIAAFRFGVAWADGVAADKHIESVVGSMLASHVDAILYLSLTIGLGLGSVVGRWMLAGLSCTSFTIFLIWVLITLGGLIPPFFVSSYWTFSSFEGSKGQQDCAAIFGDSNEFLFARTACDIRAATYIAGIALILVAVLGPVFTGLIDYTRVVCLPRRRAWVAMPKYWRDLVAPQNPRYQTQAQAGDELVPLRATGATTSFFNFQTKISENVSVV